jgi:hypothetical protein
MQTIKDYIVFSSLSRYRPSPLSQYQAIASAFVRIIFGLHLHVAPSYVLSCRRCSCLEDLWRKRRPPTIGVAKLGLIKPTYVYAIFLGPKGSPFEN